MTSCSCRTFFVSLSLSLFLALNVAAAPPAVEDPDSGGTPRLESETFDETSSMRSGEALLVGREDSTLFVVPDENATLRFIEDSGADAVIALTALDREGNELGSGRVIVVRPAEVRELRVRQELDREGVVGAARVRVEILEGDGRIRVAAVREDGSSFPIQPENASHRSRRVRRVIRPTSFALIDAAEESQILLHDVAVLYRVYALFEDVRLPGEYRGNDTNVEGSQYLTQAREQFDTFSTAVQQALLPFLTPPAYTTSWANTSSTPAAVFSDGPPPCQTFSDNWAWVDTSNGFVRVWYPRDVPGDTLNAASLAAQIDSTIWPKMTSLMAGHPPLSDLNEACGGGNGRLDIYLVDARRSFTVTYGSVCNHVPVFVLLRRADGPALAVHEIFHAIQYGLTLRSCPSNADYRWWAEASAHWAQDYVYPDDQREQLAAHSLLDNPELTLDLINDAHEYGAYLLPFYVYRSTGSAAFVKTAWERCATQDAIHALDQTLVGGFEQVWPNFALHNWNRKPVEDYKTWDSLASRAAPTEVAVNLAGRSDAASEIAYQLPRLSATYFDYKFSDGAVRFVTFWNGATYKLTLAEKEMIGLQYQPDPGTAEQRKGAKVQALIKLHGQDQWQTADWTDRPFVTYCRDQLAERIDEIVVVVSNSDLDPGRKLQPASLAPVMFASNMACWQWKGTGTYVDPVAGLNVGAVVTWTRVEASQGPPFVAYKADGVETWSISGNGCSGSGTRAVPPEYAFLSSYNYTPSQGSFNRAYTGAGADPQPVTVTCGNFTGQAGLLNWLMLPPVPFVPGIPLARFTKVSGDGTLMDDTFSYPGATGVWKWHFEAEREP